MMPDRSIANATARAYKLGYDRAFYFVDKPGFVYPAHAHEETWLHTLEGSVEVVMSGATQLLTPGSELVIPHAEFHAATVGKAGWAAVAGWHAAEKAAWAAAHP